MKEVEEDKKDIKKYMRDTITYVVNKKLNTFSLKLDNLSKKVEKNIEYTTLILEELKKNNSDINNKINILENKMVDFKNSKNINKTKIKPFINKELLLNDNNADSDNNIDNDNNDDNIELNGNVVIDNVILKNTYKDIKNEVYDIDINFIKQCLHQNSIDGEIELFKKIYIDNITKEYYPIRHIKKKYQYWKDEKMNDDDSNGTYIKNTIINNIEQSYFSINTIEEYNNDIDQFIKNQEYISKLSEQKYKDKFFLKIITIINI